MQDTIDELNSTTAKRVAEIEAQRDRVSAAILVMMNELGADSVKTSVGTVERKREVKASASDWGAVYRFIRENDAFDMLEKRIKQTFVREYCETHKDTDGKTPLLPPGVSVYQGFKISVKKPSSNGPSE